MLFDSPAYFVFLIPVVLIYWRLNRRQQNIFLLLASYFFYGWWDWRFLALMIGSTTVDFLIAQKIDPKQSDANRRMWFVFSLVVNFSILGTFKYFNFFAASFSAALNTLGVHNIPLTLVQILLPDRRRSRRGRAPSMRRRWRRSRSRGGFRWPCPARAAAGRP